MAVAALQQALSSAGRYMLIGGVAVIARGVRRLTDDVDATVWAEGLEIRGLLRKLATHRIVPRIDDAQAFARRSQVLLLQHEPSGVDIDLSLAWLPFESEALDRADLVSIGRRRVAVATAEDLIIYKAIAARERDLSDIQRLFEIYGRDIDLERARRVVSQLADVLERPELVDTLDRLAGARPRSSRGRRQPKARKAATRRPR
ncbi:MAG TPA: nucleotidyltransferase [Polyangiaceae bacterium]|nr:nucleotidyltransferase [Polyangiaceae bacterium]